MSRSEQIQQHGMVTAGVILALFVTLFLARLVAEAIVYCAGLCLS